MNPIVEDILMHYGMPRRSGRYPYGSGENPYQHSGDFLSRVQELKKSGMSETDIAKNMGLTTTQLRTQMSLAKDERRALQVATAKGLREKGYSLNEIAAKMGFSNDSSVRSSIERLHENQKQKKKFLENEFYRQTKAENRHQISKMGYRGVSKKHTPTHIAAVFKISPEGIFGEPFTVPVFTRVYDS